MKCIIKALLFVCVLLCLIGCSRHVSGDYIIELGNGYKLWRVSYNESFITWKDDVVIIGPKIVEVEKRDEYVLGRIETPDGRYVNETTSVGYFILSIRHGVISKGMDEAEWFGQLKKLGLKDVRLKRLSGFKIRMPKELVRDL